MSATAVFDEVPPTIATTPLPRSKDPFAARVVPPPPKYVAKTNWLTPLKLGFSLAAQVTTSPFAKLTFVGKFGSNPFARFTPPEVNAVAETVFPPAKMFPEESSNAPQPDSFLAVLPPPTFM